MSPLTASLQVLEEHAIIRLAPSNIMDSKEPACLLLPSHTSLPYFILGLITDNNNHINNPVSNNFMQLFSLLTLSNNFLTLLDNGRREKTVYSVSNVLYYNQFLSEYINLNYKTIIL